MKEYYFYCPNCNAEYVARSLPTGTVPNLRDGYGTHIHHYECPRCHNLDAGYMLFGLGKMNELPRKEQEKYFQHIIGMYQNIRGIKRPSFEELLALDTAEQIEALTGIRLKWYQKLYIKWWMSMKKSNPHLAPTALFESILKGRW